MKQNRPFLAHYITLIIFTVFISGCWDSRELNQISILAGYGWDKDPDTDQVELTFQFILPGQVKNPASSSSGEGESAKSSGIALQTIMLDHSEGRSTYEAANRFLQQHSRIPFYKHIQVYAIGQEAARQGIYPLLDNIARSPGDRHDVLMVVAEKKASDILAVSDSMENIQALGLAAQVENSANNSRTPAVTFLDFSNRLVSRTTAPIAPIVGINEEQRAEGQKSKEIRIKGTAVFKKDKLIGQLNEEESSGLMWVINEVKQGFVTIPGASLEIARSRTKIIPILHDGEVSIEIEIHEQANLIEYSGAQPLDNELLMKLQQKQDRKIESQIQAAMKKSLALNADIFGFGDAVHRKYKKEWKDMESKWEEIYPQIKVKVKVKSHIEEIGDINMPLAQ